MKETPDCRQHKWIPLLGKVGRKHVPTALFTCLNCGEFKVGTRTIKISRYRMDMGDLPLRIGTAAPAENTGSGLNIQLTAAVNVNLGDACYIDSSGRAALVNATTLATSTAVLLASQAISAGQAGFFVLYGVAHLHALNPGWRVGGMVYASTNGTSGQTLTQTAPNGKENMVQILGVAVAPDTIFFHPQLVQVEHA